MQRHGMTLDAPSFFNALPQQLGLTLKPAEVTRKIIVIDSVQKPTTN
jgi:uncharacterized protein (TIGR03435 family)